MSYGNESTAPNTSVGADEGRSHNQVGQNITDPDLDFKENREFFKKVQSAQTRVISIKEQKNTQYQIVLDLLEIDVFNFVLI